MALCASKLKKRADAPIVDHAVRGGTLNDADAAAVVRESPCVQARVAARKAKAIAANLGLGGYSCGGA